MFSGAYVPQAWLSAAWGQLTGGYQVVDVRGLKGDPEQAAGQVARYVSRQVGGYLTDQGQGRVLESQGWLPEAQGASQGAGEGASGG